jgi:hypothetical protein
VSRKYHKNNPKATRLPFDAPNPAPKNGLRSKCSRSRFARSVYAAGPLWLGVLIARFSQARSRCVPVARTTCVKPPVETFLPGSCGDMSPDKGDTGAGGVPTRKGQPRVLDIARLTLCLCEVALEMSAAGMASTLAIAGTRKD